MRLFCSIVLRFFWRIVLRLFLKMFWRILWIFWRMDHFQRKTPRMFGIINIQRILIFIFTNIQRKVFIYCQICDWVSECGFISVLVIAGPESGPRINNNGTGDKRKPKYLFRVPRVYRFPFIVYTSLHKNRRSKRATAANVECVIQYVRKSNQSH